MDENCVAEKDVYEPYATPWEWRRISPTAWLSRAIGERVTVELCSTDEGEVYFASEPLLPCQCCGHTELVRFDGPTLGAVQALVQEEYDRRVTELRKRGVQC